MPSSASTRKGGLYPGLTAAETVTWKKNRRHFSHVRMTSSPMAWLSTPTEIYMLAVSRMTSPPETAGILLFDSEGEFIDKLVSLKSAGRFQPQGLVFGPDTNLYVSDTFTDTVQRFDANGTFRDTFAASGNPRPIGPTGAIFGPDANSDGNKDLYVSSSLGDAVLRYDGATGRFMDE